MFTLKLRREGIMTERTMLHAAALALLMASTFAGGQPPLAPRMELTGSIDYRDRPSRQLTAVFAARLPSGYHVNSNTPPDEFLRPTRLSIRPIKHVAVVAINYPEATTLQTRFFEQPLPVYGHEFAITVDVVLSKSVVAGEYRLEATLAYQACSEKVCFPPATQSAHVTIVVPPNEEDR